MKIVILQTFTGFPDGTDKPEKTYIADAVVDVGDDFGKMVIGKGLAKAAGAQKKEEPLHEAE